MKKKVAYSSLIGAILKEERIKKYLRQNGFENIGLIQSTVMRIELGESCTLNNLGSLCSFYGKNLSLLIRLSEDRARAMVAEGYEIYWEMTPSERRSGDWVCGEDLSRLSQEILSKRSGKQVALGLVE